MKAIGRLYIYLEHKGYKPTSFEKENNLSNGYLGKQLKRNSDLGESILIKIIDNCQDLNPLWLIKGEGEMIKNPEATTQESIADLKGWLAEKEKVIKLLEEKVEQLQEDKKKLHKNSSYTKSII